MDEKEKEQQETAPLLDDKGRRVLDDKGRRVLDDNGEPIHWATRYERVVALILALIVIAITIAFAYSLSTGDLIRR